MRQAPRSPLSFKLQRVANVPEHPPPSTRLMSCAHIANRQLSRIIGASIVRFHEIGRSRLSGGLTDLVDPDFIGLSRRPKNLGSLQRVPVIATLGLHDEGCRF